MAKKKIKETMFYGSEQGLSGVPRLLEDYEPSTHEIVLCTLVFSDKRFVSASFRLRNLLLEGKSFNQRYKECISIWSEGTTFPEILDFIISMRFHGKLVVKQENEREPIYEN